MESFLIYILKASALLGIFYLSYLLLLKKDTSFQLNRKFLISGIVTSAVLPALYLTRKVYIEASSQVYNYIPTSEVSSMPIETPTDWWQIAGITYLIITGFFLLRLVHQLRLVVNIILKNNPEKKSGLNFIKTTENQLPFSFFRYIVFNPNKHSAKDLNLILEHEKVHALQYHSADILLVNLVSCILWFNPFAWFYKRSVEQNLEFIADRETVTKKAEIKEYQHALLKVSIADLKPALTNHFYQSFIKKRILMLNKKSSTQSPAWKLSLVMPLLLAFMLLFNVKTEAQVVQEKQTEETAEPIEEPEVAEEIEIEEIEIAKEIEVNEGQKKEEVIEIEEAPEVSWTNRRVAPKKTSIARLGIDPLYILNGKKFKASKLSNKYIGLRSNFEIFIGEKAVNRYGKDAKSGVIIIPDAAVIRNFNKEMKDVNSHEKFRGRYIMVGENGKPNFINLNSGQNPTPSREVYFSSGSSAPGNVAMANSKNGNAEVWHTRTAPKSGRALVIRSTGSNSNANEDVHFAVKSKGSKSVSFVSAGNMPVINSDESKVKIISQDGGDPLFVIDGEEQTESFEPNSINPETIASMMVLKGANATEKYGAKAKNGVVEIHTKKSSNENGDAIFLIKNTFSDSELEALKQEARKKTGYTLDLMNIVRNHTGIITDIEVKFHGKNSMVHSEYSNSNGIPNIHVGLKNSGGFIIYTSE